MEGFDGGETFQLEPRVERAQRFEHVGVIAERQRRVQSADDVQFRDAEPQRLARLLDHLLDAQLKAVLVALLAREGAELAAQDAVVGVVEVAVDDVAGAVADLAFPGEIGERAKGIEVFRLEQAQCVGLGEPFTCGHLVVEVAQRTLFQQEIHCLNRKPGSTTSVTVTIRNTRLTSALSRKNAFCTQFMLRRRARKCSSARLPPMMSMPTKYAMRNRESNPKPKSSIHITRCAMKAACSAFFGPHATTSERSPARL